MSLRAVLVIAFLLGGCGLKPLYSGGANGAAAQALAGIAVAPIPERSGWLVRQALTNRLGDDAGASRYRLEVLLDDKIEGFGIRSNDAITRERRTLRARYKLIDLATGAVALDATAAADAGIDATVSEYATIAAEQTALERLSTEIADQIVTRLALFARNGQQP